MINGKKIIITNKFKAYISIRFFIVFPVKISLYKYFYEKNNYIFKVEKITISWFKEKIRKNFYTTFG